MSVETEVLATEPWDDDRGLVETRITTTTDEGTTVLSMIGKVLWERRQD